MTSELGVAVVGLGSPDGWAARAHVPALQAVQGLRLRALCARTAESSREASDRLGVPGFHDVRDMVAALSPDDVPIVVVATRVASHADILRPLLSSGRHVLCEWPLARTVAEAMELARLTAEHPGSMHVTGLQGRSVPEYLWLRDLIESGYLGTPLSTTIVGSLPAWGRETTAARTYLLDKDQGASMLSIPVGHALDTVQHVLGPVDWLNAADAVAQPSVAVTGSATTHPKSVPDQIALAGAMGGSMMLSLHFRGGETRTGGLRWEIQGTEGDLVVQSTSGHLQYGDVTVSGGRGAEATVSTLQMPQRYRTTSVAPGAPHYALAAAYSRLRDALGGSDVEAPPDFAHAVELHRLLHAVELSAASGVRLRRPWTSSVPGHDV